MRASFRCIELAERAGLSELIDGRLRFQTSQVASARANQEGVSIIAGMLPNENRSMD